MILLPLLPGHVGFESLARLAGLRRLTVKLDGRSPLIDAALENLRARVPGLELVVEHRSPRPGPAELAALFFH